MTNIIETAQDAARTYPAGTWVTIGSRPARVVEFTRPDGVTVKGVVFMDTEDRFRQAVRRVLAKD